MSDDDIKREDASTGPSISSSQVDGTQSSSTGSESSIGSSAAAHAQSKDDGGVKRTGLLAVAAETMKHIERAEKAEKEKAIVFRHNDRVSAIFLALSFAIVIALTGAVLANPAMRSICLVAAVVADGLMGFSILWFVLLRFGTLRTLEARHALLCWQLMLGSGVLFAFYAMNVILVCFTLAR